jgi:hypothetical protein
MRLARLSDGLVYMLCELFLNIFQALEHHIYKRLILFVTRRCLESWNLLWCNLWGYHLRVPAIQDHESSCSFTPPRRSCFYCECRSNFMEALHLWINAELWFSLRSSNVSWINQKSQPAPIVTSVPRRNSFSLLSLLMKDWLLATRLWILSRFRCRFRQVLKSMCSFHKILIIHRCCPG